jgi:predicted RNA-binding Zn-ribbon protein involved in translation (DUF1610 family)
MNVKNSCSNGILKSVKHKQVKVVSNNIVFTIKDNNFTFICPHCGYTSKVKLPFGKRKASITCKCKKKVPILFNDRDRYRKPVKLSGELFIDGKVISVMIDDISLYGVGGNFTSGNKKIKVGQKGKIRYTLPDSKLSVIVDDIEVMWMKQTDVGVIKFGAYCFEALDYSQQQKDKGFFIL